METINNKGEREYIGIFTTAFLCMTSLLPHVLYKYKASASQNIIYSLYIFPALKPRHVIVCKPHTNLGISSDSLCDTLISIICPKIALCSHGLSSY